MEQPKGFFGSLFDLSFTSFVTSKLIKVLFILAIVGAGVVAISMVVAGFLSGNPAQAVLVLLIVAPLSFLLGVIWARVLLEIIIVIFRMSEHLAEIAQQGRGGVQPPQA